MTALASVLERLGISQYLDAFVAEGFDTWETLLDVTEEDLDALNVKRGHRRKLQREIASARGLPIDRPLRRQSPPGKPTGEDVGGDAEKLSSSPGNSGQCETPVQAGKRKYRRHPKPDEEAPEKPPSAYVIFSNRTREHLKGQSLSFAEMAKVVGQNWQALTAEQREAYEAEAAATKHAYNEELIEYKKTDSYKNYMEYLADFKAKQGIQTVDAKRRRNETGVTSGTEGRAGTNARRQTVETGGRVRTTSADLASVDSVSTGLPSPLDPAPSSIPWSAQFRYSPAHIRKGSRDVSIGQSPVSPISSTNLSRTGSRPFNTTGRLTSRVEHFGDSPLQVGYGRGPNPPSRLISGEESHTPNRLVALHTPVAPVFSHDPTWPPRDSGRVIESQMMAIRSGAPTSNLSARIMEDPRLAHQQALIPFSDSRRGDASSIEASWISSTSSPPLDAMPFSFRRPPLPVLPPLRASPTKPYESAPSSHAVVSSRGTQSEERPRPRPINEFAVRDAHPRHRSLPSEASTSQSYSQEQSPGERPAEESPLQDLRPSTPISVLLKASETIFDRDPD